MHVWQDSPTLCSSHFCHQEIDGQLRSPKSQYAITFRLIRQVLESAGEEKEKNNICKMDKKLKMEGESDVTKRKRAVNSRVTRK